MLIKLSQNQPNITPNDLVKGDIVRISKVSQETGMKTFIVGVVSHVVGNDIYGWRGYGVTLEKAIDNAFKKFKKAQETTPDPVSNSKLATFDPNNILIEQISDVSEVEKAIINKVYPVEEWKGTGMHTGWWNIKHSPSFIREVQEAIVPKKDNNGVYVCKEITFDYVRKNPGNYGIPNTVSLNRTVRPHFVFTINSRDRAVASSEYLLTRDIENSGGEWRVFITYDGGIGDYRMTNVKLGNPFILSTIETLYSVKDEMKSITKGLRKLAKNELDLEEKRQQHGTYNALRAYYQYLKKLKNKYTLEKNKERGN